MGRPAGPAQFQVLFQGVNLVKNTVQTKHILIFERTPPGQSQFDKFLSTFLSILF
jgi:hypothetical protein